MTRWIFRPLLLTAAALLVACGPNPASTSADQARAVPPQIGPPPVPAVPETTPPDRVIPPSVDVPRQPSVVITRGPSVTEDSSTRIDRSATTGARTTRPSSGATASVGGPARPIPNADPWNDAGVIPRGVIPTGPGDIGALSSNSSNWGTNERTNPSAPGEPGRRP